MSTGATAGGQGVVMHVRCPDRLPEEVFRQVLEELANLSPVVQALPPTAALVDLRGALSFHGVEARRLGEILRIRTISRLGVDVRVGIGPSRSRQVRGFLRAQDGELAGHLRLRRRSSSRLGQQGPYGLRSGDVGERGPPGGDLKALTARAQRLARVLVP